MWELSRKRSRRLYMQSVLLQTTTMVISRKSLLIGQQEQTNACMLCKTCSLARYKCPKMKMRRSSARSWMKSSLAMLECSASLDQVTDSMQRIAPATENTATISPPFSSLEFQTSILAPEETTETVLSKSQVPHHPPQLKRVVQAPLIKITKKSKSSPHLESRSSKQRLKAASSMKTLRPTCMSTSITSQRSIMKSCIAIDWVKLIRKGCRRSSRCSWAQRSITTFRKR